MLWAYVKDNKKLRIPMDKQNANSADSMQEKEILDILMDSDLYLELPLKERHLLFQHIVNSFAHSNVGTPKSGNS